METSEVRKRVLAAIERAKRGSAERRTRADEAAGEYTVFLEQIAVPMFRQLAGALKASGYPFGVFSPGGSVRLMSEKSSEDFIEVSLDTTGDEPLVMGHTHRARGRRVLEAERPVGTGPIRDLTEEHLLDFLILELEPFVEK
jgi:hypothetical protein